MPTEEQHPEMRRRAEDIQDSIRRDPTGVTLYDGLKTFLDTVTKPLGIVAFIRTEAEPDDEEYDEVGVRFGASVALDGDVFRVELLYWEFSERRVHDGTLAEDLLDTSATAIRNLEGKFAGGCRPGVIRGPAP